MYFKGFNIIYFLCSEVHEPEIVFHLPPHTHTHVQHTLCQHWVYEHNTMILPRKVSLPKHAIKTHVQSKCIIIYDSLIPYLFVLVAHRHRFSWCACTFSYASMTCEMVWTFLHINEDDHKVISPPISFEKKIISRSLPLPPNYHVNLVPKSGGGRLH